MPQATLKFVAKLAGVAPVTVSRVINGSENVAAATRDKILEIIRDLDYTPNIQAANLRRKKWIPESSSNSRDRIICADERLKAGRNSYLNVPSPPEGAFIFSPEEGRALAQQILRLRRDLDRLRNHTERIQTCVQIIQRSYSRRLSSGDTHHGVDVESSSPQPDRSVIR